MEMLLNGIRLTGYSSTEDSAQFELAGTTVKDVAALDGQLLTVTDDEGGEVEAYVGYSIAYIQVEDDGTIRMRAVKVMDDTTAAAIEALSQKVDAAEKRAEESATKAEDAKTVASTAGTVATEAKDEAKAAKTAAEEAKSIAEQAGSDPQVTAFARMAVLPMAADMTVSEGASVFTLWPERRVGDTVKLKDFFWYGGELYRCNQTELTITEGQEPDKNLPALYGHVSVAQDGILVWDADDLTGAPDIYNTGTPVHYPDAEGPVYVSGRDGNTSVPGQDEWWTLRDEA